jgi:hypothetical protein
VNTLFCPTIYDNGCAFFAERFGDRETDPRGTSRDHCPLIDELKIHTPSMPGTNEGSFLFGLMDHARSEQGWNGS